MARASILELSPDGVGDPALHEFVVLVGCLDAFGDDSHLEGVVRSITARTIATLASAMRESGDEASLD